MAAMQHTEILHTIRLNSLCRICGRRSKTTKEKGPVKLCKTSASELYDFLGIKVSSEEDSIMYSSTLCSSCYRRFGKLKSSEVPSQSLLQTVIDDNERTKGMWTQYNPKIEASDCSVCHTYIKQMTCKSRAKPSKKRQLADNQSESTHDGRNEVSDNSMTVDNFQPGCSSTPQSRVVKKKLFDLLTSRMATTQRDDISVNEDTSSLSVASTSQTQLSEQSSHQISVTESQTMKEKNVLRPIEQLQAPLTKAEEEYLTHLVRIKLQQSDDKRTLVCKTKAHPITLKRVIKAKKTSCQVSSPLRKRRAKEMSTIRKEIAGSSEADLIKQQSTELKLTTKQKRTQILKTAGVKHTTHISSKQAAQMRTRLSLSWSKERKLKKMNKSVGITMDCEKKEREFVDSIMCGKIEVNRQLLSVIDKDTNKETVKEIPVASIDNLPAFVSKLLDQYEEREMLTWHDDTIPENEIWIKIGGDHGGGSFKLVLSVVNVENPNSKNNSMLVLMFEAKDTNENLRKVLGNVRDQLNALREMTWKGKHLQLFMFGDYDFLLKMYGMSGAQGRYPCLWCKASKTETQYSPAERVAAPERTLENIKEDLKKYQEAGSQKAKAKEFYNVIRKPVWDIEITHVAPPYLHLLLGTTLKHHDSLIAECHSLDKQIAEALSKEDRSDLSSTSLGFSNCVKHIQRNRQRNQGIVNFKQIAVFSEYEGPIVAKVEEVLNKHKIQRQAYHGGAFIGNHCDKYMRDEVVSEIAESIEQRAFELTDDIAAQTFASDIKSKYLTLNTLYSRVHKLLSHKKTVRNEDIKHIKDAISAYMSFYRGHFLNQNVIPKQHILEDHCIQWIERWGFGLALHGEQGGEEMHASVNSLKRRAWGIRDNAEQLRVMMKEQLTQASPMLLDTPPKKKKK